MLEPKNVVDQETISVYDNQADNYATLTKDTPSKTLETFIAKLSKNAYVLDLGCGPAHDAAIMKNHNLQVDPVDASIEMVRLANETYAIGARQASFADIDTTNIYDGIWASFSLLHATRSEFPHILTALHKALKHDGYFYLAMKLGEGEARDKLGRFYTYYSQEELTEHLNITGFTIESIKTGEAISLAGVVEPWIRFLSQKK